MPVIKSERGNQILILKLEKTYVVSILNKKSTLSIINIFTFLLGIGVLWT